MRLFPDIRAIERDYFRQTGMFPPQHLIVLRRPVWEANKWIARALTDAFIRVQRRVRQRAASFPYASPWLDAELEETEALMGADFHPDGFERTARQSRSSPTRRTWRELSAGGSARRSISRSIWRRDRTGHACSAVELQMKRKRDAGAIRH